MKRIRHTILAAMAALTLTAVGGAGSASASADFAADAYPVTLTGVGSQPAYFDFSGGGFTCNESTLAGSLASQSNAAIATPTSTGCTSFGSTVVFATNGCQLSLDPQAETASGTFSGNIEIGPWGCGPMTVSLPFACKVSIGAQSGIKATFQNEGSGTKAAVSVKVSTSTLKYTQSGACGSGTFSNGGWTGDWKLTGTSGGSSVGIRAVDVDLASGLYMAGKASENPAEQPRLEAEDYPADVAGSQNAGDQLVFSANTGTASCEKVAFSASLVSQTTALPLSAQSSGCVAFGLYNVPITMNSCKYEFNVLNAGPPYTGTMDVACSKPGDVIEIKAPGCKVTIGAQEGLGGVTFSNSGTTGSDRRVVVDLDVKGIKYTEVAPLFPICASPKGGTFQNGALSGSLTLAATI